jgi:hypothetical protein
MKTFKILLISFIAITTMSFSCSAEEETNSNSFTVPEQFRGTWNVYSPNSRATQTVVITANSVNINNEEVIIDEGFGTIITGREFGVLGEYFADGTPNPNGYKTVRLYLDEWYTRLDVSYLNENTNEQIIVYTRR